jgi:hypothetical protein
MYTPASYTAEKNCKTIVYDIYSESDIQELITQLSMSDITFKYIRLTIDTLTRSGGNAG